MKPTKFMLIGLAASMLLVGCGGNRNQQPNNGSESKGETETSTKVDNATTEKDSETATTTKPEPTYLTYDKVITPKGAPTLAWYDQADNDKFVTSAPDAIPAQFGQANYGMIVFDFYNGLNAIKKMNSNYRLARIITGGNLYLVSRSGKATLPTAKDRIVAFGPGGKEGLPVMSLKALHPEINLDNVVALKDAAEIQGALITGTLQGQEGTFDYFVIPQPALQGAIAKLTATNNNHIKVIECLRDELSRQTDGAQKYLPQAGLFVHQGMYNQQKAYFDQQFELIDQRIENVLNKPGAVKAAIEEKLPTEDAQKAKFGFPAKMVAAVQGSKLTPNGFGFVSTADAKNIDIQAFLTFAHKTDDFSNLHLVK